MSTARAINFFCLFLFLFVQSLYHFFLTSAWKNEKGESTRNMLRLNLLPR